MSTGDWFLVATLGCEWLIAVVVAIRFVRRVNREWKAAKGVSNACLEQEEG